MDTPVICELCKIRNASEFMPVKFKYSGFLKEFAACESCYARYVADEALNDYFERSL